jgi:hypothetical protein
MSGIEKASFNRGKFARFRLDSILTVALANFLMDLEYDSVLLKRLMFCSGILLTNEPLIGHAQEDLR